MKADLNVWFWKVELCLQNKNVWHKCPHFTWAKLCVLNLCGFIYFCFTDCFVFPNCLHFSEVINYLMADSHYVNLTHLVCQQLLLVLWTVRCSNAGNVHKPRNISTKKHVMNTKMKGGMNLYSTGAPNRTSSWLAIPERTSISHLNEQISTTTLCDYAQPIVLQNWIIMDSSFSVWRPRALFIQSGVSQKFLFARSFRRFEPRFWSGQWC